MSYYEIQYNLGQNAWGDNPNAGWTTSLNFELNNYDTAEEAFAELATSSRNSEYASEDHYRVVRLEVAEVIPRPAPPAPPKPPESTEWEEGGQYAMAGRYTPENSSAYPFTVKAIDASGTAYIEYPDGRIQSKDRELRQFYVKV